MFIGVDPLPEVLATYQDSLLEESFNMYEVFLFLFALAALVALIGLIFFTRWSRPVFAIGVFVTTAGMFYSTPVVQSALEAAICQVALVIEGMIIAIAYFSELKHEFKNKNT
jgi:uncharacterized membrane protein